MHSMGMREKRATLDPGNERKTQSKEEEEDGKIKKKRMGSRIRSEERIRLCRRFCSSFFSAGVFCLAGDAAVVSNDRTKALLLLSSSQPVKKRNDFFFSS